MLTNVLPVACNLEPVFRFSPQKLTWPDASESCKEWGGKLGYKKDWQTENNTEYWGVGGNCPILKNWQNIYWSNSICD